MSNIAGIYWDDTAAAPGISLSVYWSGCIFHCPGCHNPQAWDFDYGQPFTESLVQEIIQKLNKNNVQRKLSILGGEPLNEKNRRDVWTLIQRCKQIYPNLIIYVWTGYTLQELREETNPLIHNILSTIDCLIDGRYEQDKRDITLPLRGSSNQQIYYKDALH